MKSLKKVGAVAINACFTFGVLFSFLPSTYAFSDVGSEHVYFDAITYMQTKGIVQGYADGTYRPDNLISRAEFIKIVMSGVTMDSSFDCGQKLFNDVSTLSDNWYRDPVCKAFHKGIIVGYADKTFKPDQSISFVEAAKIIIKANNIQTAGVTEPWSKEFTDVLNSKNAVPITINDYNQKITRGEMADIIYLLKGKQTSSCVEAGGKYNATVNPPSLCCSGLLGYFPNYSKGEYLLGAGGVCLAPTAGLSEALDIYNSNNSCTSNVNLGQTTKNLPYKNSNFNGYSFPMESFKNGCEARCDVNLDTKTAKIGWMCI